MGKGSMIQFGETYSPSKHQQWSWLELFSNTRLIISMRMPKLACLTLCSTTQLSHLSICLPYQLGIVGWCSFVMFWTITSHSRRSISSVTWSPTLVPHLLRQLWREIPRWQHWIYVRITFLSKEVWDSGMLNLDFFNARLLNEFFFVSAKDNWIVRKNQSLYDLLFQYLTIE